MGGGGGVKMTIFSATYCGFRGNSQTLIRSFLTNRQQYDSSKLNIKCGVPQGYTSKVFL